jgi:hypothetical protein
MAIYIYVHRFTLLCFTLGHVAVVDAPLPVAAGPSLSHGFFRRSFAGSVPCPVKTVLGISLMPGTGCPLVMSSTLCANEVG